MIFICNQSGELIGEIYKNAFGYWDSHVYKRGFCTSTLERHLHYLKQIYAATFHFAE